MEIDDQTLLKFLEAQVREHGCTAELDGGLWVLFAVAAADLEANALASALLRDAPFAHDAGLSHDDQWMIYFVDTANRWPATQWLEDLAKLTAGEIRPVPAAPRALARELCSSDKPHRLAQQLAGLHERGEIHAGLYREPALVRTLLDRLHQHEPLFFAAFLNLLNHQLIDLVVLLRQLLPEDVAAVNDLLRSGLSADPFLQTRQDAAAEIRSTLLRFHLINPIDQQKNTAIKNPYAVHLEVVSEGDRIIAPIDGTAVTVSRINYINAIRAIRRNLYRGADFGSFDTQAPWMNEAIAYPFRFIKQRVDSHRELTPLDALYMLERAVEA